MANDQLQYVLRRLHGSVLRADGVGMTDGELLECFLRGRSEAAFEALVRRHGPMVLGVCRRILGNPHDADDAFQATFLVLVRKAAAVTPREHVGNWLYGVAFRTALEARATSIRRRTKERQARTMPERAVPTTSAECDCRPLLDQELSRLPAKYRLPIVLCDLESRPRKDVAKQLGIPEGTLSSRLACARGMLAKRLRRRGIGLSVSALGMALAEQQVTAAVPTPLLTATVAAGTKVAAGGTITTSASASVAALTEGVLKAMLLSRLKTALAMSLLVTACCATVGVVSLQAWAAPGKTRPLTAPMAATHTASPPEKRAAGKPAGLEEFYKSYALADGQVVKRVAPPFLPSRLLYYQQEHADQARAIPSGPTVMYFRWNKGKLGNWGMSFSADDGAELRSLAQMLAELFPQELEGDEALLKARITGDFIVREGVAAEKVVGSLGALLQKECNLPVTLRFREVERKVIVATGKYRFSGLPGRQDNEIDIYGKQLISNSGAGGGGGDFERFLKWIGAFIDRRIVHEADEVPTTPLYWYYHRRSPATDAERKEDTDPEAVLKHITEQTGLTFKEEVRPVRVLFVKRTP